MDCAFSDARALKSERKSKREKLVEGGVGGGGHMGSEEALQCKACTRGHGKGWGEEMRHVSSQLSFIRGLYKGSLKQQRARLRRRGSAEIREGCKTSKRNTIE